MSAVFDKTDQLDMFVADIIDVAPKGDLHSMEYPIFAISSKKDTETARFENANGNWLEIIPSVNGRATIHDKDLLLYCFGQIAEAMNRGKSVSRRVKITAYDFLVSTGRTTDGKAYKSIGDTLGRLRGTTFRSNINNPENKKGDVFGLIDSGTAVTDRTGRLDYIEVVLSEQLFASITSNKILTYNREYFQIRSPYERRMYEICRKFCGNQKFWEIGVENLYDKFGVKSERKEFRRKLKELVIEQGIPDYFLIYRSIKETGTVEKLEVYKDKNSYLKQLTSAENEVDG